MAPFTRTCLAIRRRREANLVPIVISDDETPDSSAMLVLTPADVPQEEVQQPAVEVCPDCGVVLPHLYVC